MYKKQLKEQGSVFFYILIAIILLAALTYSVAQSSRNNTNIITEQQAKIAAQNIIEQGQTVSDAVQRLILRGFNETQISFENGTVADYELASCAIDTCKIFNLNGGGLNWIFPPENANDGENWIYTGEFPILDNGSQPQYDMTMVLPNINDRVCQEINFKLGLMDTNTAPILISSDTTIAFDKLNTSNPINASTNFASGLNIAQNLSACVRLTTISGAHTGSGQNLFIHTLYAG